MTVDELVARLMLGLEEAEGEMLVQRQERYK